MGVTSLMYSRRRHTASLYTTHLGLTLQPFRIAEKMGTSFLKFAWFSRRLVLKHSEELGCNMGARNGFQVLPKECR